MRAGRLRRSVVGEEKDWRDGIIMNFSVNNYWHLQLAAVAGVGWRFSALGALMF